ncbi:M16 family metallopeptidase [Pararoseomonas indoligenes]|uniref:Insulinase family protein n=1 Tax=Roseomonas indoligenes TaxID=2820811 RepID=A0A940MUA3_9PROT|nr:pitrilysin family protein [Pararoseomonas indoligenes]MBP0491372.1 insulinase family protein [Pararoseomonas indoligenes]
MPPLTRRAALAAAAASPVLARRAPAETVPAGTSPLPAALPAVQPIPAERPLFGATLWQMPNGLRVAHVGTRGAPVVAHYLFYGVGAGDDPEGRSGLAHFLEHMMFKGSEHVPDGEFSRRVAREGGQDNAFTSRDVTAYHQTVEATRLKLVAMMEADRLRAPLYPAEGVETERAVILEERRQRTDSSPRARFRELYDATMWGRQHWRGRPIIGWQDEIRAITRDDIVAFHRRWYNPANAVLVVNGAVDEAALRRVVEDEYGGAEGGEPIPRRRAEPPVAPLEARIVRNDPGLREAQMLRSWIAPTLTWGRTEGDKAHAHPLEVLAHLLGGGPGSRLHKALVQGGLAIAAGAGYDSDELGADSFALYATPRGDTTPARLEAAIEEEVSRLLDEGVTAEEVARSQRQLTAGVMLSLDGIGAAPRLLGGALAIGLPVDAVEHWPARIRAVTPEAVMAAARAVFTHPSLTGWLLPEGVRAP